MIQNLLRSEFTVIALKQISIFAMEASGITSTQESMARLQQGESDVDRFCLVSHFLSHGIRHHEYAPEGQTIKEEYYLEILH